MENTLFIFAHQDDEYPVTELIKQQIQQNNEVYCVYLTNGEVPASKVTAKHRNKESLKVLQSLEVRKTNILFIGEHLNIEDGKLFLNLEKAYEELQIIFSKIKLNRILCLSWEGGHQDHDASHLIALALASKLSLLNSTFQYSLYNGYKCRGPLYRVMKPLKTNGKMIYQKLSLLQAIKASLVCWQYTSQKKTWLGLFPEAFLRFLITRKLIIQPVKIETCAKQPHEGTLFYEKRFKIAYANFKKESASFKTKYLC